jgi:hypothetical protein
MDFLSGETANPRMLERMAGAAPGVEAEGRYLGRWAIEAEQQSAGKRVLDVILTEPGNVT